MNLRNDTHKSNPQKSKYRLVPVVKNNRTTKKDLFLWLALVSIMFFGIILALNIFLLCSMIFSRYSTTSPSTFKTIKAIIVSGMFLVISYMIKNYLKNYDPVDPTFERIREQKRTWFIANGVQVDAKIVLILKRVQIETDYSMEAVTEHKTITYIFDVEYYDKEERRYRTVSSECYCNDIRKVFADDKVKIYFNPNNKNDYIIEDIKLRQSDSDPICKIPTRGWTDRN